ncbi:MAG TPA: hypothetical protein VLW50_28685 [Streptosporangiaceae bacterium]|nr:hypothetical protein [Streptosporangiaceae bacterium]
MAQLPAPSGRLAAWAGTWRPLGGRCSGPAGFVVAAVVLFFIYLRLSRTYPENSDEANILLMAWDMLHGNLLLHGWSMSHLSFYTTELPQYMLVELVRGLNPDTAHVAAAMTYTLAVLLAALLAKGQATGKDAAVRVLLASGIMLAPQLGVGIFVLLLSVGHIGTSVPLLLIWLILDRARPRWYVPVVVGAALAWVLVADSLVLVVGVAPLVLVCGVRVARELSGNPGPVSDPASRIRGVLAARWYEVSLAGAALVSVAVSSIVARLIRDEGGYLLHSVPLGIVGAAQLPVRAGITVEGLLALFGAGFNGLYPGAGLTFALPHGVGLVLAALHLAGVALVAWALWLVARRFVAGASLVDQVLAVAVAANVAVYLPSAFATGVLNAREMAVVLPFGAALAGRTLASRIRGSKLAWVLGAVLIGYGIGLAREVVQPSVPPANERLAVWLAGHHLTYGLGGYWEAGIVTVDTGDRVTIRAVLPKPVRRESWESKQSWYDPRSDWADFVVFDSQPGFFHLWLPYGSVQAKFGQPVRTYHVGQYTIMVWDKNLLAQLG